MTESRSVAITERLQLVVNSAETLVQPAVTALGRTRSAAVSVAQENGAALSALLAPISILAYSLSGWALTASLGWTDSFAFSDGPLSNWLIWLALGLSISFSASVLKRQGHKDS